MKKFSVLFLSLAFAALLVPQAGAQTVHYGLKGGLNFADVAFSTTIPDQTYDFCAFTRQAVGVYANFRLGPVDIQPELLFSQRGLAYVEADEPDVYVEGRYKFNYIEVPILVKYSFLQGPARPFLFAGPSISFMRGAQSGYDVDALGEDSDPDYEYYYDVKEYVKKSEFAAVFGAGIDFHLPKFIVSLDARYHLGFSEVLINEGSEYVTSIKNRGISVMVGIGF